MSDSKKELSSGDIFISITWSSTDEGFIRTRSHKLAMKQMIGEKVLSYMTKEKLRTDLKGTLPIDSFHYVHTLTY